MKSTVSKENTLVPAKNTACLSDESFQRLQEIMYEHRCSTGSRLFWEGDPAEKIFFIKKGHVKTTKLSDNGKELIISMFWEGDLFGEIGCYGDGRYSYNAEAADDCIMGVIQNRDLEILLWQHGDVAIDVIRWMSLMHRITQAKYRDLMLYGKPGALCSMLIRLAKCYGKTTKEGIQIAKRISNSELGDMINATRETVNRMLSRLKDEQVIIYQNGTITIKDLEYLKQTCRCEECPKEVCRF